MLPFVTVFLFHPKMVTDLVTGWLLMTVNDC